MQNTRRIRGGQRERFGYARHCGNSRKAVEITQPAFTNYL